MSLQQGGISIAGTPRAPPLDLGIPGLAPPPHLADAGGTSNLSAAAAFSRSLPRSLSAIPAGFLAAGDTLGRSLQLGSLPARGLTRSGGCSGALAAGCSSASAAPGPCLAALVNPVSALPWPEACLLPC